jgi:hypothetical protein
MSHSSDPTSCNVRVAAIGATINGTPIHAAEPIANYHVLLGEPSRIAGAGPPAPFGHRNNQIHFYDNLGITLNEHHYTYQIQAITFVLDTVDAIHPTIRPFSGTLDVGGAQLAPGVSEAELANSQIQFTSQLRGTWFANVSSAPIDGREIRIAVDSAGHRLKSGRRSQVRRIVTITLCLKHDPWDVRYRP